MLEVTAGLERGTEVIIERLSDLTSGQPILPRLVQVAVQRGD